MTSLFQQPLPTIDVPVIEKPMRSYPAKMTGSNTHKINPSDQCQTPFYGFEPLLPYLTSDMIVWEPAAGDGNLVAYMKNYVKGVVSGDILTGQNYFDYTPPEWDIQITNVPFSLTTKWLARAYELGKPFALLLKESTTGTLGAQRLFAKHGRQIIHTGRRINFHMPNKGYSGKGAQFATAWFTWGLNLPKDEMYVEIDNRQEKSL